MDRLSSQPVISKWSNQSDFLYNYNTAYMPMRNDANTMILAVRVQNLLPNAKTIYDVAPSKIAISKSIDGNQLKYTYIREEDVIIDPDDQPYQNTGAEDPRIVLYNNTYYLFYTAVSKTETGDWRAQLALATCNTTSDPLKKESWQYHGPLFADYFWSKSGSLLIHNETYSYLLFNDSNVAVAVSKDFIHYEHTGNLLFDVRNTHFDSELVEAGPEPLRLSDGNYLFLYNSARQTTIPNPKPGWRLEYNLGWVILDGNDPLNVLARSEEPIFSPELDWERCDNESGDWKDLGLTPLVVFVEGWKQIDENRFLVWYQGCDSTTGLAELKVVF
ncbi:unnamed protein product [Didymodactylos carnosus]|uniref:Arabinanase/levansucrase/invertase n=1 Tax=Didymodactylos carnosus TaxID=1234261 RepID=A0A814A5R1_9BILA|nr:unnamed protein product [Didymodactylos carnosus]CAF0909410.1 unnamed protein product [Didymodactylos carnosus]CAF3547361.1 unnamed protein product [Didymodactylos carnosus]CAF3690784.1 unnamed protein product [Didymodactylos carnosus]